MQSHVTQGSNPTELYNDESPEDADPHSDADSDLEQLQGDIAKYNESVREFLASHHGAGNEESSPFAARGGPRGRARGPRKAAKPRGDITARLSKVNQAFLAGDYSRALDLVSEVIRINAETHQAWTALASIFGEMGEVNKSLSAMVYAAHLRPKDVAGWLSSADFALDTIDNDEDGNLHTARLCYSAAVRADSTNLEARLGKAVVCHRQGHLSAAITEYNNVLKRRPHDLDVVRKLAEACIDSKNADAAVNSATAAYRRYFDIEISNEISQPSDSLWHDVGIYVELFASNGHYREAIRELKSLARWLVGRSSEQFWDEYQSDDREWDVDSDRRSSVPESVAVATNPLLYGNSLPRDLRARLAIYRLAVEDDAEAFKHLSWLDPTEHHTREFVSDFPFLVFDIASELYRCDHPAFAAKYLELLREVSGEPDAAVLLQLGRCYLANGQQSAAEDCFLAAIEFDPDSIDPRIELANMYEEAKEDEEAFILTAEAKVLQGAQGQPGEANRDVHLAPRHRGQYRTQGQMEPGNQEEGRARYARRGLRTPVLPRRYRPKRFGAPDQQQKEERAHAAKLSRQFDSVRGLKQQILSGRKDLITTWMQSSQELVDEFRSLKKFYPWDKYLRFLGAKSSFQPAAEVPASETRHDNELTQKYEQLTQSLGAPEQPTQGNDATRLGGHHGISFDEWRDMFLDYAISLAIEQHRDEAYQVCEAARDATVFQGAKHDFIIHIAWSVCAIWTNDQEKAVTIARHLMRSKATSDSSRMFALVSTLCQSPMTWYTSSQAQKHILRQIKAMDKEKVEGLYNKPGFGGSVNSVEPSEVELDVCLLMLYGHILFTSTSYTNALVYFLRARAVDPENPMVNLSLGLAFVHDAFKRQTTNRQYQILQGMSFMNRYIEKCQNDGDDTSIAAMLYNIGRLYHLLGISSLASKYYSRAVEVCYVGDTPEMEEISLRSKTNHVMSLLDVGNKAEALAYLKGNNLVL